jgi:hypothetical protein
MPRELTTASMGTFIRARLIVRNPVPGVTLRVQRGRDALVPPAAAAADAVTFELAVEAAVGADGRVTLRGREVQGPPAGRFVYVNAGTYAGQADSPFGRRAKVPLGTLGADLIAAALAEPGALVVAEIDGRSRDGGPAAATVPLLGTGWRLVVGDT